MPGMSQDADPPPDKPKAARRAHHAALSEQEMKFCLEYLRDHNGTRAALAANYATTPAAAAVASTRLLNKRKIIDHINSVREEFSLRYKRDMESVLFELSLIGHSDIEEYTLDPKGKVEVTPGSHPAARRAVRKKRVTTTQTVDTRPDGTVRRRQRTVGVIELHDKLKALKILHDHFKALEQKKADGTATTDADRAAAGADLLVRLGAILQAGGPDPGPAVGPTGGGAEGQPVDAVPGAADGGVSQPGG